MDNICMKLFHSVMIHVKHTSKRCCKGSSVLGYPCRLDLFICHLRGHSFIMIFWRVVCVWLGVGTRIPVFKANILDPD